MFRFHFGKNGKGQDFYAQLRLKRRRWFVFMLIAITAVAVGVVATIATIALLYHM